jgi:hypothetical protein
VKKLNLFLLLAVISCSGDPEIEYIENEVIKYVEIEVIKEIEVEVEKEIEVEKEVQVEVIKEIVVIKEEVVYLPEPIEPEPIEPVDESPVELPIDEKKAFYQETVEKYLSTPYELSPKKYFYQNIELEVYYTNYHNIDHEVHIWSVITMDNGLKLAYCPDIQEFYDGYVFANSLIRTNCEVSYFRITEIE